MKQSPSTTEDNTILAEFESGRFRRVGVLTKEKVRYQQYARATVQKNRSINIRVSERDLRMIKALATEKGLPYQTFIGSLLHQYSNGKIKEVSRETV